MEPSEIKVQLVDDDPDILEFLSYNIRREGFNVFTCSNGFDAISTAIRELPHIILLDVMMPDMDGYQTCYKMKLQPELKNSLIVFLSARNEEYSKNIGFNAGADEYFNKPIRPRDLINRIYMILRRQNILCQQNNEGGQIKINDLMIDEENQLVYKNNVKYILSEKEFKLLTLLVSNANKIVPREEIYLKLWDLHELRKINEKNIKLFILSLQRKLQIDSLKIIQGKGFIYLS